MQYSFILQNIIYYNFDSNFTKLKTKQLLMIVFLIFNLTIAILEGLIKYEGYL
jgi:hypothetical protein